jgi:hypothetical protein
MICARRSDASRASSRNTDCAMEPDYSRACGLDYRFTRLPSNLRTRWLPASGCAFWGRGVMVPTIESPVTVAS